MKKIYRNLLVVFGIEFCCISIMNKLGIQIHSWIGNVVGVVLFFAPIMVLLYLLSKDDDISKKYRILSKILFWYIAFCFVAGASAKAIAMGWSI